MNLKELKLTPKRKEICEKLELHDSRDILSYYPFRYEELVFKHLNDWQVGDVVTFDCELLTYPSTFRYGKRSTTRFKVLFEDEYLNVTIFNRPWVRDIRVNQKIVITGKYDGYNKVTALNYYTKPLNELLGIVPVYSVKEGINQNSIRKIIEFTYEKCKGELIDRIPSKYIESHRLISYEEAIKNVHFPKDGALLKKALSRLKYEEFLRFYTALNIINGSGSKAVKKAKVFELNKVNDFISHLPFTMTPDQYKSTVEILEDLRSNKVMYRLLQGEVGSGKTAVAMTALYANALAGYTGALMAPTEILAKQHYLELKSYLEPLGLKVKVLYSGSDDAREIKKDLKEGKVDVIVGTHALFSDDVEIDNLGLVITDEQHRFGVRQRKKLREKGKDVDFLMMSATPIPRTLASVVYGDMDISTIETMPQGRKGCKTYLIKKNSIVDILPEMRKKLKEGRQIYIIAAAIEASENYKAKDVENLYNSLKDAVKPYRIECLHGRMKTEEKDEIMERFNKNETQILLSTTVVEVGVNVKNATMMIIYDADRFGLSQLHQLRGRVQRSSYEGSCYLLTDSKEENVLKRLEVLVKNNNGFEIAYEDLKQRGPGDILGTRQSGLPSFILGNFVEDSRFIKAANDDAKEICGNLSDRENRLFYDDVCAAQSDDFLN